ncbi:S41 family peptidase [Pedobacter montanisoli]|uniref:S41 family peptidase n=1 Tax=Pedobacter montanisoli TaxID=2923277 RepID=A0ABS9ZZ54_9SPHI|nr:S41 family peptidase [Pedobacter montanisoli]MCJ0743583.1 S41 family peptidase [Pedobacter montanisoli]
MKIKIYLIILFLIISNLTFGQTKYQKDFGEFWNDINDNYAYLKEQNIDWKKVKEIYQPKTEKISTSSEFIQLLESVLNELYNGHSSLNTNLNTSNRLIPSGQDIYVEKINNKFIITDLRKDFGAEKSGLKVTMEVTKFNGKPIDEQLNKFLPKFTQNHNSKMYQFALDMLFAGTHNTKREISILENGIEKEYFPDEYKYTQSNSLLESKIINKNTAYIKINNSLGNNQLILNFDKTLDSFLNYRNLIIDLTETPNGGNTTVARAIMGRFIDKILPYQRHEFDEQYETKRVWTEFVMPRKKQFKGKVYVLVGHWTGSMGEGIAIGFDGMKRAEIIGTKMAGLLGAISNFQMTETKIGYQFPTERLYQTNGKPREDFLPKILTRNIEETYKKISKIK